MNKKLQFNGFFSYEKLNTSFVPIIQSFDNNSISFWTDAMLMNMTDYTITNLQPQGRTYTLSGSYTVLEEKSSRMVRVHSPGLFLIREYAPEPFTIAEDALVQKGKNTVTLYAVGQGTHLENTLRA